MTIYNPAIQSLQCLILGLTDLTLKIFKNETKNYNNNVLCLSQEEFIVLVGPSKIQIKYNWVKNPNWPEANQLAIYKCNQGVELGPTKNKSS